MFEESFQELQDQIEYLKDTVADASYSGNPNKE